MGFFFNKNNVFPQAKVAQVNDLLDSSNLIFSVPSAGLSVKIMSNLRNRLPENSKAMVVKNTLMRRYELTLVTNPL